LRLVASRRLGVLDEHRVPYEIESAENGEAWAQLSAGGPGRLYWRAAGPAPARPMRVAGIPIWGRVEPDTAVEEHVRGLPGRWTRETPVLDERGVAHSWIWRTPAGGAVLPFDPDEILLFYRSERYRELGGQSGQVLTAAARRLYYALRPLLPRPVQISLRRRFVSVQERTSFPRWPVETALHDFSALVLGIVAEAAGEPVPTIAPWPRGYGWALVLTHDVETAAGRDAIGRVRAVEAETGYRSSWNLVPERYAVDDELVARLRSEGCEVGVHGLRHDGRDLESLRTLHKRLPAMRRWAERWHAVGFRAPATHRVWDWMPLLGFDYDSSYPDTDPYEPIAGGCCTWLPFFNKGLVELPITLPQDHTLFVVLRRGGEVWHEKLEFLCSRGGMGLLITHPDYLTTDAPLAAYRRLLEAYVDDDTAWKALPWEVSDWWRRRAGTFLTFSAGRWSPVGAAADQAAIEWIEPVGTPSGQLPPVHTLDEQPVVRERLAG
jgi:hypothetical protein